MRAALIRDATTITEFGYTIPSGTLSGTTGALLPELARPL